MRALTVVPLQQGSAAVVDVSDPEPAAGEEQAGRISIRWTQRFAIECVGDNRVVPRFLDRDAAREL